MTSKSGSQQSDDILAEAGTRFCPGDAFGSPILLPTRTLYHDLSLEPDASVDEIRWAKGEAVRQLLAEKSALDRDLEAIYSAVPGLMETYAEHERLARSNEEMHVSLASVARRLADLEKRAQSKDSRFREKRARSLELSAKVYRLNRSSLDKPEERLTHDLGHPPLALLKLSESNLDGFLDGKTMLFLLRRELSRFLAAQNEPVFHPSDLTREDFTADFTPNPYLDGPAHE